MADGYMAELNNMGILMDLLVPKISDILFILFTHLLGYADWLSGVPSVGSLSNGDLDIEQNLIREYEPKKQ